MLRAYKTPIFAKAQNLTHSPAHEEKHAGQGTPLHYTPLGARFDINVKVGYPKPKRIVFLPSAILAQF